MAIETVRLSARRWQNLRCHQGLVKDITNLSLVKLFTTIERCEQ
jgi:hypothetical protein